MRAPAARATLTGTAELRDPAARDRGGTGRGTEAVQVQKSQAPVSCKEVRARRWNARRQWPQRREAEEERRDQTRRRAEQERFAGAGKKKDWATHSEGKKCIAARRRAELERRVKRKRVGHRKKRSHTPKERSVLQLRAQRAARDGRGRRRREPGGKEKTRREKRISREEGRGEEYTQPGVQRSMEEVE